MICTENVGKSKRKLSIWNLRVSVRKNQTKSEKKRQKCENRNLVKLRPLVFRIELFIAVWFNCQMAFCLIWREVTIPDFRARCETIGPENKPF